MTIGRMHPDRVGGQAPLNPPENIRTERDLSTPCRRQVAGQGVDKSGQLRDQFTTCTLLSFF